MATLANKSIKGTLSTVFKYNNNPDKNLPTDGLTRAASYIRGEHSIERLFSRGHNGCSCNPQTALEQFKASEALYRENKGGAREAGMGRYEMTPEKYYKRFHKHGELNENGMVWVEKTPTIAEHLFLSFPPEENVSYETQCEIADKLCSCDILKDFYAISNRHYNTDNDHSHILVSGFSKDGSKKLSLGKTKRNELRKELDRICVSYGLSIIDDPALRFKDPEREAFVRQLVVEGKVNVYAPADYQKQYKDNFGKWMIEQIKQGNVKVAEGKSHVHNVTQAEAYERWIASQKIFLRDKDKDATKYPSVVLVTEEDMNSKQARVYYWGRKYKRKKNPEYYYAVRIYDDSGRRKSSLELLIELLLVVMDKEYLLMDFSNVHDMGDEREQFFASTNWSLQNSYNAMHYQDKHGIRTQAELSDRVSSVGTELSEVRQGKAYYEKVVNKGDTLYKAIRTHITMEARLKKNGTLTEEEQLIDKEATRIMTACNLTETPKINDFISRRAFAERKINDLTEREKRLKEDYYELKFVEKHIHDTEYTIEREIYRQRNIDDMINYAQGIVENNSKKTTKNAKNIQKGY